MSSGLADPRFTAPITHPVLDAHVNSPGARIADTILR